MGILNVKIYPDPALKRQCLPVTTFDNALHQFIADLKETMYSSNGIGLAGNQTGDFRRIFVMDVPINFTEKQAANPPDVTDETDVPRQCEPPLLSGDSQSDGNIETTGKSEEPEHKKNPLCFINPEIVCTDGDVLFSEGCLSIPGVREWVKRRQKITLRYRDENGNLKDRTFIDLEAVCVQHEVDHLNGMTFFDRLPVVKRAIVEKKYLKSLKKNDHA